MDDPGKTCRGDAFGRDLPKRFYKRVDVADRDGGFALLLDEQARAHAGQETASVAVARALPRRLPRSGGRKRSASTPPPCR